MIPLVTLHPSLPVPTIGTIWPEPLAANHQLVGWITHSATSTGTRPLRSAPLDGILSPRRHLELPTS
jgi:hypothetical protein